MVKEGKGWEWLKADKAFAKPVPDFRKKHYRRPYYIFTHCSSSLFSKK
jgi:hypothetical protein